MSKQLWQNVGLGVGIIVIGIIFSILFVRISKVESSLKRMILYTLLYLAILAIGFTAVYIEHRISK